ncbi:hypothetical protein [Embleya sp. NPDC001921]
MRTPRIRPNRRTTTAVLAVVVAGSLLAGCGGGGKKHRSRGGGSHSSSGGSSSSGSSGSYGSTSGGARYTTTPTVTTSPTATSSATGGSFGFDDVNRSLGQAYANLPSCPVPKWSDADLKTRVPAAHRARIVQMRSYDCYAKSTDSKPLISGLGTFLTFATEDAAALYLRDVEALSGVSGFLVAGSNVATVGNPAGLKNPRLILDRINTACRECGRITAI